MRQVSLSRVFSYYHPAAVFIYIAAAVFCAMFALIPVCTAISFVCASAYSIFLNGLRAYAKGLRLLIVMYVVIIVFNVLLNRRGMTTLFYLLGDESKPVTWEAMAYALCAGGMLVSVFIWFQCYQALITDDKFMYLFGRILPTSSMAISMILKLVPVTVRKYHAISETQRALNGDTDSSRKGRFATAAGYTGVLFSRTMEDSIETADSMRARGYGSCKRSRFVTYRLRVSDVASISILLLLCAVVVIVFACLSAEIRWYPMVRMPKSEELMATMAISYAIMLLYPFFCEVPCLLKRG